VAWEFRRLETAALRREYPLARTRTTLVSHSFEIHESTSRSMCRLRPRSDTLQHRRSHFFHVLLFSAQFVLQARNDAANRALRRFGNIVWGLLSTLCNDPSFFELDRAISLNVPSAFPDSSIPRNSIPASVKSRTVRVTATVNEIKWTASPAAGNNLVGDPPRERIPWYPPREARVCETRIG